MRRDDPGAFFARQDQGGALLARRNHWLDTAPDLCLSVSDKGKKLVEETWQMAADWNQVSACGENLHDAKSLARKWEADFILLDSVTFTLAGGCVCFPSSWNLQESTGRTLDSVHGVVPNLTEQIGDKINRFLKKLSPGQVFLRENWGLTRTDHLNYHPALKRERLDESATLEEVFLRIEHQAFVKLPSGILLGVRIEPVRLDVLIEEAPETASRLSRQLATMPAEVAAYKSLDRAVTHISDLITKRMEE